MTTKPELRSRASGDEEFKSIPEILCRTQGDSRAKHQPREANRGLAEGDKALGVRRETVRRQKSRFGPNYVFWRIIFLASYLSAFRQ